jgi:hypothetical protein
VAVGATVELTGRSTDPDGDALTYRWFLSHDRTRATRIADPNAETTSMVVDAGERTRWY